MQRSSPGLTVCHNLVARVQHHHVTNHDVVVAYEHRGAVAHHLHVSRQDQEGESNTRWPDLRSGPYFSSDPRKS